ncbi:MAG: recombinase family protein [bacterium]
MKKAISYIRVSTDKQADHGVSLDAQAEKIKAMAIVREVELVETIIDAGESAKSLNRTGMKRLLELVNRREIDTVIVTKLDRLTRSVRDLADLLELFDKRGVSLVSVNESLDTATAAGRLVLNVMASVSQWEREAIGERTRDAMQHKKAIGELVGSVPFGYTLAADGIHLELCELEQNIISKIKELKAAGFSLRNISGELNRQGFRTRKGSAWRHEYINNILRAAA